MSRVYADSHSKNEAGKRASAKKRPVSAKSGSSLSHVDDMQHMWDDTIYSGTARGRRRLIDQNKANKENDSDAPPLPDAFIAAAKSGVPLSREEVLLLFMERTIDLMFTINPPSWELF